MPRRIFKKFAFKRHEMARHWIMAPFRHMLHDPRLWGIRRRWVVPAFALGVFIAWLPFPGHTATAILLALLFRVNIPIAAVSTCFFASWTLFAVGEILVAGLTALVSQAVGANRDDEAAVVTTTGAVIAVVLGVVVAIVGWYGSPVLFHWLLDDPEIIAMGSDYLSIFSLLAPILYLGFAAESDDASQAAESTQCTAHEAKANASLEVNVEEVELPDFGWTEPIESHGHGQSLAVAAGPLAVSFYVPSEPHNDD